MTLETSDHQRITLHFPRPLVRLLYTRMYTASQLRVDDHLPSVCLFQQEAVDQYVEVLGCVEPDLSVSVERIVNYGVDFGRCGVTRLVPTPSPGRGQVYTQYMYA